MADSVPVGGIRLYKEGEHVICHEDIADVMRRYFARVGWDCDLQSQKAEEKKDQKDG
jgi:hypothetical protein